MRCLPLVLAAALTSGTLRSSPRVEPPPDLLIGYTEFRTDLPGGRYVNVWTMRAAVIKADGTGRRVLADELTREKGFWVQFYGWSPDGRTAILLRGWESEENGKWEEEHETFRYSKGGWLYDGYLFDLKSNKATKVTGVERISHYTVGLGYLPGEPTKLGFLALVDGVNRRFRMDLDGKSERLTDTPAGSMHYHPQPSPDGKWLLYGSKRDGVRQLYLMRLEDKKERRLTDLKKGYAAMWPHWRPAANKP